MFNDGHANVAHQMVFIASNIFCQTWTITFNDLLTTENQIKPEMTSTSAVYNNNHAGY